MYDPERYVKWRVRKAVLERDKQCVYCGLPVAKVVERSPYGGPNDDHRAYDGEGRAFHFDHRIPFSKGGLSDETNIVLACARCNLRKGAGDKPNDRQERKESYVDPRQGKLALKFD